jgi:hypothetical protein
MTRRVLKPQPAPWSTSDLEVTPAPVEIQQIDGDPWPRITIGRVILNQEVRYRAVRLAGLKPWSPYMSERWDHREVP